MHNFKFADINNPDILHVCTSCYCHAYWECCGWAGICPHSQFDDGEFSMRAYNACVEIELGAKITDMSKKHHVSIMNIRKYKRTIDDKLTEILIKFPDCTMKCCECVHKEECK